MGHPLVEFIIGLLALLFLAWIVTGQYKDPHADDGKFIKPLNPLDSGEVYDAPIIPDEVQNVF